MAAGMELPKTLFVHSHWTIDGVKVSFSFLFAYSLPRVTDQGAASALGMPRLILVYWD